jgi:hypothetical protein
MMQVTALSRAVMKVISRALLHQERTLPIQMDDVVFIRIE